MDQTPDWSKKALPEQQGFNMFNVGVIMGSKNFESGDRNYFKGGLGVNYLRQIHYKYRVGIGIDVYFTEDSEDRNDSDASTLSKSSAVGINGAWNGC